MAGDATLDADLKALASALSAADAQYATDVQAALGAHQGDIIAYNDAVGRVVTNPGVEATTAAQAAWTQLGTSRTAALSAIQAAKTGRAAARTAAAAAFKAAQP